MASFYIGHVRLVCTADRSLSRYFKTFKEPRSRFQGIDSATYVACAGIFKQSKGARNLVGMGLSYRSRSLESILRLLKSLKIRALAGRDDHPILIRFLAPHRLFYSVSNLKVHKIEIFFGFDFEICIISLLVMSKY